MKKLYFFLISLLFLLGTTAITFYSYTQVDLNLTLSNNMVYQRIQQQLINIGYFNRPLSTVIFLILFIAFTIYYLLFIVHYERWKFSQKQIWTLILSGSIILVFSYPAFAHDIFNYIFDARILVTYHQNPWVMTPLDFPQDEWTRFMRWTHVSSVYPPGWILTTIPFYLFGFGKFVLTLFSFKILGLISFLASSWLMLKLAGQKAWMFWSFNPMVLIESLSSVHNEIVMVVFTLLGFWFYREEKRRRIWGYGAVLWGGLIKYMSFLLLPFLNHPVWAAVAAWIGALVFFYVREVNPWYILLPVAISFMSKSKFFTAVSLISSLVIMYRYYPCVAIFSC